MGRMEISSRLEFAAEPTRVYEMMTDRSWLEELVSRSEATSHQIDIAGPTTRVQMGLSVPDSMKKFAGATMTMVQTVTWGDAAADGSRQGTLVVEAPGMPVDCKGQARLYPGGKGTIVEYTGNLKVNIPFVGGQVEKAAAPYVKDAIDAQQVVGDQWLAARG